jgi:hypothetical protein
MLASVAAGGSTVLAACASGGGDTSTGTGGATSAENPFGVTADAPLDVVIFKGGYGDDYAKFHEELYRRSSAAPRSSTPASPTSVSSCSPASTAAIPRT